MVCIGYQVGLAGFVRAFMTTLGGKRTTKTLSKEVARECQRRIKNYRKLQQAIEKLLAQALADAPWSHRNDARDTRESGHCGPTPLPLVQAPQEPGKICRLTSQPPH